jgi:hyperosmotically inducible protein
MKAIRTALICALTFALGSTAFAADKSDSWITTKTKLAMWTTGGIPSTDVSVDTINGVVTLYGKVNTEAQKTAAAREAKKIDGVKTVRNLLQVVPESREKQVARADKDVKESVDQTIGNLTLDKDTSVKVKSVDKGLVFLTGKVADLEDELRIVSAAAQVPGVRRVATEIKGGDTMVDQFAEIPAREKPSTTREALHDNWVTADVKMKLIADSNVPALDVNVDTRDGKVFLFGTVPSVTAKAAAEEDARKVKGVASIENKLEVVPKSEKKVVAQRDEAIEKDLKKEFGDHEALSHVDVEVKGGVVRLTGTVPTTYRKLEAATLSRSKPGVRAVMSEITVKSKND